MTKVLGNAPLLYRFCLNQDLAEIIDELVPNRTQTSSPCSTGELVSLLVVNRLLDPQPLYKVDDWMKRNGVATYFPCDASFINDDRIGRELDFLYPYWEQIKQKFVRQMVQKYHIDPSLIHYDITSLYFEGKYDNEDMVTYGYSRDQKPDKKQINLAVNMTDKNPFPLRWQVIPGNTSDTSTVIANMEALKALFQEQRFVLIGDRAMMSEEIYKEGLNYNYDLIVPLKDSKMTKRLLQEVKDSDLHQEIIDQKTGGIKFRLGEYIIPYNEDPDLPPLRAIVVWSKSKARTNRRNRERKIQKRRQELSELKQKLNQPYYRKYSSIERKISKIMGKDPINEGFSVVLTQEDGVLNLEVHEHQRVWDALAQRDGFYILATTLSRDEYPTLEVFNLYKRQHLVEKGFRTLKKEIGIRPIFVHQNERIIGLVNITLLALCVYSLLKILLDRHNLDISVKRMFELLPLLVIIQFLLPDQRLQFQLSPIPAEQNLYLRILGVEDIESWLTQQLELHFDLANSKYPV